MTDDYLEYEKETKSLKSINLDSLSVDELRSYIEQLKNEIARVTLEIDKKKKQIDEASKIFR
tara:strand:+ start:194 stop:379 length:186 start_codon:yes stop_codon:yes gene_type:complete